MKCPNCGRDVPEGLMYCDVCGTEFQMVPEFEPEIETQMDKILSGLASKIDGSYSGDTESDSQTEPPKNTSASSDTKEIRIPAGNRRTSDESNRQTKQTNKNNTGRRTSGTVAHNQTGTHKKTARQRSLSAGKKKILISIPVLIVFVVVLIVTISVAHKTSSDYIRLAMKSYEKGDRTQALEYLLKAKEEAPQEAEAYLLRASWFREIGDTDSAVDELVQITNSAAFSEDGLKKAYTELAAIYYDTGNSEALHALIGRCPFQDITDQYARELMPAPEYVPAEGEYEGEVEISFTLPEGAVALYYTLDGSEPDESKALYTGPIMIDKEGEVTVKAAALSDQGLIGSVQTAVYKVIPVKVKSPQVLQQSGNYSKATKIVVMADTNLTVHYTTDEKKMPDEDSPVYEEPIEMPTGETYFNFVCIDAEGNKSEIVTRQYILEIERRITEQMAVGYVHNELQNKGHWSAGTAIQVEGTVEIGSDGEFYFIREYKDGVPTGLLYVVNTQTGLTKRLGYDSRGQMVLMAF